MVRRLDTELCLSSNWCCQVLYQNATREFEAMDGYRILTVNGLLSRANPRASRRKIGKHIRDDDPTFSRQVLQRPGAERQKNSETGGLFLGPVRRGGQKKSSTLRPWPDVLSSAKTVAAKRSWGRVPLICNYCRKALHPSSSQQRRALQKSKLVISRRGKVGQA